MFECIWIEPGRPRPFSIIHDHITVTFHNKRGAAPEGTLRLQLGHCAPDQPHGPIASKNATNAKGGRTKWLQPSQNRFKQQHVHWEPLKLKPPKNCLEISSLVHWNGSSNPRLIKLMFRNTYLFYLVLLQAFSTRYRYDFCLGVVVHWFILQKNFLLNWKTLGQTIGWPS